MVRLPDSHINRLRDERTINRLDPDRMDDEVSDLADRLPKVPEGAGFTPVAIDMMQMINEDGETKVITGLLVYAEGFDGGDPHDIAGLKGWLQSAEDLGIKFDGLGVATVETVPEQEVTER